ncbi:hypothetical protein [Aquimarina sp. 2304DJ70-9]|uniref:hypothetical protein n=1 Tax=Aquimarina penaris TaxID=3231044 RepID=UPI003461C42C
MNKILSIILILCFISCNSERKTEVSNTKISKLNPELAGIYEYETPNKRENHQLYLDIEDNKLIGFYFGTESSGEHGISHYGNPIENVNFENNKIDFEIGIRELYESTRNKVYKPGQKLENQESIGISRSTLKYSGEIIKNKFILNCISEFNDCWENRMEFKKISELN